MSCLQGILFKYLTVEGTCIRFDIRPLKREIKHALRECKFFICSVLITSLLNMYVYATCIRWYDLWNSLLGLLDVIVFLFCLVICIFKYLFEFK